MVGVIVDRPVGEDDVRPLALQELAECLRVGAVDDRAAIDLAREEGGGP